MYLTPSILLKDLATISLSIRPARPESRPRQYLDRVNHKCGQKL